jgi:hypothetical protein
VGSLGPERRPVSGIGRNRRLLAALAAGLAAAVLSGVTSHTIAGVAQTSGPPDQPVSCGQGSAEACFATVRIEDVAAALRQQGFTCTPPPQAFGIQFDCDLTIGVGDYHALLMAPGADELQSLLVDVKFDPAGPPGPAAVAFLSWFVELPFANDAASTAAASQWLLQHLPQRGVHEATINNYQYRLDVASRQPGFVRIEAAGGRAQG